MEIINIPEGRIINRPTIYLEAQSAALPTPFSPRFEPIPQAHPSAFAAASNCAFNSGVIRIWKVGAFPDLDWFGSRLTVDMYVPIRARHHQPYVPSFGDLIYKCSHPVFAVPDEC